MSDSKSLCNSDCNSCPMKETCGGCIKTDGNPFGSGCVIALCCHKQGQNCQNCKINKGTDLLCSLKKRITSEFNLLHIEGMQEVKTLIALKGSYINLEYTCSGNKHIKFFDDNKIYLGNQIQIKKTDRCYGLAADEKYLMVSEYSLEGKDAEIVLFKRWNHSEDLF